MAETPTEGSAPPPQAPQSPTVAAAGLPVVYFNGFGMLNGADVGCVLLLDNQPQLRLAMSWTVAKSLAKNLAGSVSTYEHTTGTQILDLTEVNVKLRNAMEQKT